VKTSREENPERTRKNRGRSLPPRWQEGITAWARVRSTCRAPARFPAAPSAAPFCNKSRPPDFVPSAASSCTPASSACILIRASVSSACSPCPSASQKRMPAMNAIFMRFASLAKRKLPRPPRSAPPTPARPSRIYSRSDCADLSSGVIPKSRAFTSGARNLTAVTLLGSAAGTQQRRFTGSA
jgi:hypothetical protein